ncbi:DUF6455 family protein [Mesobacterium sp. TK19101]|uniref:DUF6455 family protein n=1 Tax=Mesobacterium hydrothermale TaxID=3111907 RepID=A0ABU6HHK7_9RHOB|nr:DUF6455 family protein [Mesobacterium sp. TK19101]MEC3861264.1 DUF6455 family protein [Mesobacterium sp. TK19101]
MTLHLGDPTRHFWITRSVARVMGLNLADEMASGRLSEKAYAQMITRCRGCPLTNQCTEWLASRTDLSRTAPDGCRNASELNRLNLLH